MTRTHAAADIIASQYNSPLEAISWATRGLITAPPGSRLIAADYSNIEGRVIAWLAGETWKLDAFRDYDAGTGPDLYKVAAGKILGIAPGEVSKPQRQAVGKPAELGLGFGGAVGAILTMMKNGAVTPWLNRDGPPPPKVTLDMITAAVRDAVPAGVWADAAWKYRQGALEEAHEIMAQRRLEAQVAGQETELDVGADTSEAAFLDLAREVAKRNRNGLAPDHWTALRVIVDSWRQSHPAVVMFWRALEQAAIAAIEQPGTVQRAGDYIRYSAAGNFLYCRLPSGRPLAYPYPRVVETTDKKTNWKQRRIEFDGTDSKTKRWMTQRAYGGLLGENVTQGVSRDILGGSLKTLKKRGYKTVLHVYDEIVCEMPNGHGSLSEMSAIMSANPKWAAGLPISVDGWQGMRYRK